MKKNLTLGDLTINGLTEINSFSLPVKTLFPDFDIMMLNGIEPFNPKIMSEGLIHLTIRSWLLRQSGRNILIDSCVGANKNRPNHPDWHRRTGVKWLQELASQGLKPEDIDIVMCTHLHADHVGWNTRLENRVWVPTFPNANYVCGRLEYEYWSNIYKEADKHGSFVDSVLPIVEKGRMEFVEDGYELAKGLSIEVSSGHTPGHLCLKSSEGAIFCGDIIHSPLQLRFPELSSTFCVDPIIARETRKELLNKISDSGNYLIPAHFPDPGWTKIKKFIERFEQV